MKKAFIVLLVFMLTLSLASCATVKTNVEFSKEQSEIQSIDIYNIEAQYYEGDITNLRFENSPICTLSAEQYADFLDKLVLLAFEEEKVFFPIPIDGGYDYSGYVISITYIDGSYDIIAEAGQLYYSLGEDGKGRYDYDHADYCGDMPWSDFVEEYIEKE